MPFTGRSIHVITLNIPDPPDYGGMIDTYYRIKALHALGLKIHLHCYAYGRKPSLSLESVCEKVHYYPRKRGFLSQVSLKPYVITSRSSERLLQYLLNEDFPIFFDGLHTTRFLNHPGLISRTKIVRVHNVEHHYYQTLAWLEPNITKKLFYFLESFKLQRYERILKYASMNITVSPQDQQYFKEKYTNAILIPPFHPFPKVESKPGMGKYVLFQGDLSVIENVKTCRWLIRNVFSKTKTMCIIAGKNPPSHLRKIAEPFVNIIFVGDPSNDRMQSLIHNAQIVVLMAIKNNGFKLKLFFGLFSGRFCLVNQNIIQDTGLEDLCHIANTAHEFLHTIDLLMNKPFTADNIEKRQHVLDDQFNNQKSAQQIFSLLFPQNTFD